MTKDRSIDPIVTGPYTNYAGEKYALGETPNMSNSDSAAGHQPSRWQPPHEVCLHHFPAIWVGSGFFTLFVLNPRTLPERSIGTGVA
jgi:hypothetical protein